MGVRLTPIDLSWGNSSTFTTNINQNFDDIATLLDTFLSRTDATTNFMGVALDMNSNDINNAGTIRCDVLLIDNAQIPSLIDIQEAFVAGQANIDTAVTAAQTAQTAAELAETNAETAQAAAEAAAAGVSLPSIVGGDADKFLQVKDDETGYELVTRDRTPPAGYYDIGTHQVRWPINFDDSMATDVSSSFATSAQKSIGATGTGAAVIAPALDVVPSHAKAIIINLSVRGSVTTSSTLTSLSAIVGSEGAPLASLDSVIRDAIPANGVRAVSGEALGSIQGPVELVIPLATEGRAVFELSIDRNNTSTGSGAFEFTVIGYTY